MSLVIPIFVRGGEGAGVCLISRGGVKKRKSPDFRSPEVGISVTVVWKTKQYNRIVYSQGFGWPGE